MWEGLVFLLASLGGVVRVNILIKFELNQGYGEPTKGQAVKV